MLLLEPSKKAPCGGLKCFCFTPAHVYGRTALSDASGACASATCAHWHGCVWQGEDGELTAEEKAAGLASVFKRDDARLATMREEDEQEKVPFLPAIRIAG